MEKAKQSLKKIESFVKEEQYDNKISNLMRSFVEDLEKEIDAICQTSSESESASEIEYLYFFEVVDRIVRENDFINKIEPKKIRRTLLAAAPGCHCPPPQHCPPKKIITSFIRSFTKVLNTREQ